MPNKRRRTDDALVPSAEDAEDVIVSTCDRASREARPAAPSPLATQKAWDVAAAVAARFESQGLSRVDRVATKVRPSLGCSTKQPREAGAWSKNTGRFHVMSLHSRSIDSNQREPLFSVYGTVPQQRVALVRSSFRANAVAGSVTRKKTPRINVEVVQQAEAAQAVSVCLALSFATAAAWAITGQRPSNPACSSAVSPLDLFSTTDDSWKKRVFVMTTSANLLMNALPARISSYNFLEEIKIIARKEQEEGLISRSIPQSTLSLKLLCNKVRDTQAGVSIWAAWAILVFLTLEARGRKILKQTNITDLDLAIATCFQSYGRTEVTRRARLESSNGKKRRRTLAEDEVEDANDVSSKDEDELCAKLIEAAKSLCVGVKRTVTGPEEEMASEGGTSERTMEVCVEPAREEDGSSKSDDSDLPSEDDAETAGTSCHALLSDFSNAQKKKNDYIIRAKKKRVATDKDSDDVLNYWFAALECSFCNILKTLITNSEEEAGKAAQAILNTQSDDPSVTQHAVIRYIATTNAVKSSKRLSELIVHGQDAVPRIATWNTRGQDLKKTPHYGLARSTQDAQKSVLHACRLPDRIQKPDIKIVWSEAVMLTTPGNDHSQIVNGAMEGREHLLRLAKKMSKEGTTSLSGRGFYTYNKVKERSASACKDGPQDTTMNGIARSLLCFKARVTTSRDQKRVGKAIGEEMAATHKTACQRSFFSADVQSVCGEASETITIEREPFATPSSWLTVGVVANETLRTLAKDRPQRSMPCRAFCGVAKESELAEKSVDEYDRPQSILAIADLSVEMRDGDGDRGSENAEEREDAEVTPVAIGVSVVGDKPVRLPEALSLMREARKAAETFQEKNEFLLQERALLLVGCVQASFTADLARHASSGWVNASIRSAKRIQVGDWNLELFTTIHQVYSVGHGNVPRSCVGTAWEGVLGASVDMGSSAGLKIGASATIGDGRLHGKLLMSQEQADRFCAEFAKVHYVQISDEEYAATPKEVRGIPHAGMPGVHAFLSDYTEGLETLREICGINASRTVQSLQCLPMSPFSERISPYCAEGTNPTSSFSFRNPHDLIFQQGKAWLPDATLPELSIAREPLISCLACVSPEDNIFASLHSYLTTFLGAAAALGEIAKSISVFKDADFDETSRSMPHQATGILYQALHDFHTSDEQSPFHLQAADAAILLNVMYPSTFGIAEKVLLPVYENVAKECWQEMQKTGKGIPLSESKASSTEEVAKGKQFWSAFARPDFGIKAWTRVAPLITALIKNNGSFNNTKEDIDHMASCVDHALRGTWLVHSLCGTRPPPPSSPLHQAQSPNRVLPSHLNPVFVGKEAPDGTRVDQRGAAIGLRPCAFHQVLCEMLAIRSAEAKVQHFRNEGGVSLLRTSGLADVFKKGKEQRSAKALSPVGVDGDERAFGSREEKLKSTKLQRLAYERNNELYLPLCLEISPPLPASRRGRGDAAAVEFISGRRVSYASEGVRTKEEIEADALFDAAASHCIAHSEK